MKKVYINVRIYAAIFFTFMLTKPCFSHSEEKIETSQSLRFANTNLTDVRIAPRLGRMLLRSLQKTQKKRNTTTARTEQKSVIEESLLKSSLLNLQQPILKKKHFFAKKKEYEIAFASRDHQPDNGVNQTFTFYGRGMYFWNEGIKTKIKLRARFYLERYFDQRGSTRPEIMKNHSYLELKIKNPSPKELGTVNKYRIKISDKYLLQLFKLDFAAENFATDLKHIRKGVIKFGKQDRLETMIKQFFAVIKQLARFNPEIAKPVIAISYEREAKKFVEETYKIRARFKSKQIIKNLEYQLTLDRNIKGYIPDLESILSVGLTQYLCHDSREDFVYLYPNDAVVVETKIPLAISHLNPKYQSQIHKKIERDFVDSIYSERNVLNNFRLNQGKAGFLKSFLEHLAKNPNKKDPDEN